MSWWDTASERFVQYPFKWYRPGDRIRSRLDGREFVVVVQEHETQVIVVPPEAWHGLANATRYDRETWAADSGIFSLVEAAPLHPTPPEEIEQQAAEAPEVPEL